MPRSSHYHAFEHYPVFQEFLDKFLVVLQHRTQIAPLLFREETPRRDFLRLPGRGLAEQDRTPFSLLPCNNLFAHELPYIIPHLFLLSSTMTGVYWQSINTCLQMICFRTVWLEMYPAIQGSEYIKAFCLFRLFEEQKGTKQNGKS